jgi:hypothetical protein
MEQADLSLGIQLYGIKSRYEVGTVENRVTVAKLSKLTDT